MKKNKYIFKDLTKGRERIVYATTYGEALTLLKPKQSDRFELLDTVYNVDLFTYNIHVTNVEIYQDLDITYYNDNFIIDSVERLYDENELKNRVMEIVNEDIEVDSPDYTEVEVTDVDFYYEVK
jgi:hypothetical protein